MFIGGRRNQGHPPSGVPRPPSGGPCQSLKTRDALYKHGPPGGGRARLVTASITWPSYRRRNPNLSGWGIRAPHSHSLIRGGYEHPGYDRPWNAVTSNLTRTPFEQRVEVSYPQEYI